MVDYTLEEVEETSNWAEEAVDAVWTEQEPLLQEPNSAVSPRHVKTVRENRVRSRGLQAILVLEGDLSDARSLRAS